MGRLEGKRAIITGAAQGIGEVTARLFASEGARVCLTDLRDATSIAEEIGGGAFALHHDVADEDRWIAVAAEAAERMGGIDILINNAGIVFWGGSILEVAREDFERLYRVNVIGSWLGIKHVAPRMTAGDGSIVNIASIAGMTAINGISPYSASKWALRGVSRTAAMELGPRGIRVNTVCPGTIDTEMGNVAKESREQLDARHSHLPIARIGQPVDVALALLFLASDESSYLTGTEMLVDGGMLAGFYSHVLADAPPADGAP